MPRPLLPALALLLAAVAPVCGQATPKPAPPSTLAAAERDSAKRAVLAVIDSALDLISAGKVTAFTGLMTPEGQVIATSGPAGSPTHQVHTVPQLLAIGEMPSMVERGFDPTVAIAGHVATVWLPYDLWAEGTWSHCGVDTFTLVRTASGWRIALLAYTVEQPPACKPHPAGTPAGYAARGTR